MVSLLNLELSVPLFASLQARGTVPINIKPAIPNKIKFVEEPKETQRLYPGMYFEVPKTLTHSDLLLLDHATHQALNASSIEKHALDIPQHISQKLGASRGIINGFKHYKNRVYLDDPKAVVVSPDTPLRLTSIYNPSYGQVLSVEDVSSLLSFLAVSVALCGNKMLMDAAWEKMPSSSNEYDGDLRCGDIQFSFEKIGSIGRGISSLLCSFFYLETDFNQFIEWGE